MTRVEDYRSLEPGDIVRPGFSAGKSKSGMVITIDNSKEPYQHFLVLSVDDTPSFSSCGQPTDGRITVLTDDGIGFFSGMAVLFVD